MLSKKTWWKSPAIQDRLTIQGQQSVCWPFALHSPKTSLFETPLPGFDTKRNHIQMDISILPILFLPEAYRFSSFSEGEHLLIHLGLISQENPIPLTNRGSSSMKGPSPLSPLTPVWQKQQSKRSRDSQLPWCRLTGCEQVVLFRSPWNWTLGWYSSLHKLPKLPFCSCCSFFCSPELFTRFFEGLRVGKDLDPMLYSLYKLFIFYMLW